MLRQSVIELRDVRVCYRLPRERIPTFKEFAIKWLRGHVHYENLMALDGVSLSVRQGESVGILGRNGAGKSTMLKVIARVLRPTGGSARVTGRIAPLLELGAGFDMELSGRENVFLNGAILGRRRAEMVRRLPAIVEFAELEQFVDAPLRTYSTGMVARLGFAIATDVDPDLLLVDEVLSVGDISFQKKCLERMAHFRDRGATIVIVSHSPATIASLCDRAVWLDSGKIVADGAVDAVIEQFTKQLMPAPQLPDVATG